MKSPAPTDWTSARVVSSACRSSAPSAEMVWSNVSIGHSVVIHGCTICDKALIGNGAVLLDFAEIGESSLVGANALVTERKRFPARSLILGSPAKVVRELTDEEVEQLSRNVQSYLNKAKRYRAGLQLVSS